MSPLYEYVCSRCGKVMEIIQKFNDPSPDCPNLDCQKYKDTTCGCKMMRTLSKGGTFILKGSGWARDGYSNKKK